jgi:linearmycin/streptolysin S transport system ATP-binding protein
MAASFPRTLNMSSPAVPASATDISPKPPGAAVPLRIDSLVKRFGTVTAADSISFVVRSGECLGLLGPNGAGKSTLIRSIVGRVIPDAGQVSIFGYPAASPQARIAIGWVPQDLAIYPRLSASENLYAFGRYSGLKGQELREATTWCLRWAALEDRAHEVARHLSGGMKRRLNMAAGLIRRPRLVLLDEPTVGVDPQSRNRIFEMIESLRESGTTIIYTTHYMEEAERLCDRIAIVDHGRIIALETPENLVRGIFGARSHATARVTGSPEIVAAWVESGRGRLANLEADSTSSTAEFTVENAAQIATLLDSASAMRLEVADFSLRRPNLESVFLHLTGRELRD